MPCLEAGFRPPARSKPASAVVGMARLMVAVAAVLLVGGCTDEDAPPRVTETPAPTGWASELNPDPLPVGWMLSEVREDCLLAPGVRLHRIIRGSPSVEPLPLPCEQIRQSVQFGGGSLASVFVSGPYVFHVLELDPSVFKGRLEPALAQGQIAGKATTSQMANSRGALAAMNAGFFVVGPGGTGDAAAQMGDDGMAGDPAGVTALSGQLISEAVGSREALLFDTTGHQLRFPRTSTTLALQAGSARALVDGLNRVPGAIRNCGGVGGDSPTEAARHDVTCTDADELVVYTPHWGQVTAPVDGLEAVLGQDGQLLSTRTPGGAIPAQGRVVVATGARVAELEAMLGTAQPLQLDVELKLEGESAELSSGEHLLNGGPGLLRDGAVALTDAQGGFRHPDNPFFGLTWVDGPNPRTLVGRTASGRWLLVVCDGRQPDWSVGLPLRDAARVMQHLGATDAMNLDGGGSSTLVVRGQVVNRPSDGAERPVSDALLIVAE